MHLHILILGLLLVFAHATELTFSTVLQASAGNHAITIDEVDFLPSLYPGVTTRGFQNAMGGPTFILAPGETLSLTLTNNLQSSNDVACTTTTGEFCMSSRTNFHTHGLHVSSKGIADGLAKESDNILNVLMPGASSNYAFAIPDNHMGGTHWYVGLHPTHQYLCRCMLRGRICLAPYLTLTLMPYTLHLQVPSAQPPCHSASSRRWSSGSNHRQ